MKAKDKTKVKVKVTENKKDKKLKEEWAKRPVAVKLKSPEVAFRQARLLLLTVQKILGLSWNPSGSIQDLYHIDKLLAEITTKVRWYQYHLSSQSPTEIMAKAKSKGFVIGLDGKKRYIQKKRPSS